MRKARGKEKVKGEIEESGGKKMELQSEDTVWRGCYLNVALVSKLLE